MHTVFRRKAEAAAVTTGIKNISPTSVKSEERLYPTNLPESETSRAEFLADVLSAVDALAGRPLTRYHVLTSVMKCLVNHSRYKSQKRNSVGQDEVEQNLQNSEPRFNSGFIFL